MEITKRKHQEQGKILVKQARVFRIGFLIKADQGDQISKVKNLIRSQGDQLWKVGYSD